MTTPQHPFFVRKYERLRRSALALGLLAVAPGSVYSGDHLEAALRLLPKRPEVVVVESSDARTIAAAGAWGARANQVRAFTLASDPRSIYVNKSVDPYRCAGQRNQTCVLLLAALIWHEASHLEGADEEAAQLREETLFRQFVTEHRIDFAAGQQVLRTMAARRTPQ
jgi:hypothetical protein